MRATIAKNTGDPNIGLDVKSYADYYPFGMKMPGKFGGGNYRYAYQGKFAEKDDETGLLNFEARMYDPRIGRWISVDPAGQFASPYLGMGNNPILYTDSDGRWVWVATGLIGGAINAGINYYNQGGFSGGNVDYSRVGVAFGGGFIAGATGNIQAAVVTQISTVAVVNATFDVIDQNMSGKKYDWTQTAGSVVGTYAGAGVTKIMSKVSRPFINKAVETFKYGHTFGNPREITRLTNTSNWFSSEVSGGIFGGGYFGPMIGDEGIKPVANYILDNVDVYANGSN